MNIMRLEKIRAKIQSAERLLIKADKEVTDFEAPCGYTPSAALEDHINSLRSEVARINSCLNHCYNVSPKKVGAK